jgi:hypothetical protein
MVGDTHCGCIDIIQNYSFKYKDLNAANTMLVIIEQRFRFLMSTGF